MWVKKRCPKWILGKRTQGLKPAVPWWFNFDPYPHKGFRPEETTTCLSNANQEFCFLREQVLEKVLRGHCIRTYRPHARTAPRHTARPAAGFDVYAFLAAGANVALLIQMLSTYPVCAPLWTFGHDARNLIVVVKLRPATNIAIRRGRFLPAPRTHPAPLSGGVHHLANCRCKARFGSQRSASE